MITNSCQKCNAWIGHCEITKTEFCLCADCQTVETKELIKLKKQLYKALLNTKVEKLTRAEVNIMFELSRDADIRIILSSAAMDNYYES